MKLFVIYVGGMIEGSLIEVHDQRFIVAEEIEDTYEKLKKQWVGILKGFHIDCYGILSYADGYNILLNQEPQNSSKQLYFVNLGGYDKAQFTELHKNVFVVASNPQEAKIKALSQVQNWQVPHRDNLFEVENLVRVEEEIKKEGYHIYLEETDIKKEFDFICEYRLV